MIEENPNKGILVAVIGALALICVAIITPFAAETAKALFATKVPVTIVVTATQNTHQEEVSIESPAVNPTAKIMYITATPAINPTANIVYITAIPQAPSPTTVFFPSPTISSSGVGCSCQPNCDGVRVSQGSSVPASAILEPHAGYRGKLYVYLSAGQALVDGNLWVYVDNSGNPASKSCIEAQFPYFNYDTIQTIE